MLTTKNSGSLRIRALVAGIVLLAAAGCQPSGPKSLLLGAKYIREGDYARALKHLDKAAELLPAHPQVWNHLGLAWHGAKQPAKAAEAYQRALRIDQKLAPAHFNLGVLLLEEGRVQDAVTALSTYVALQPTNAAGFSKLGTALLRARRSDEAERALNNALRLNPKDAEAHNALGLIHVQRKRPRDAMLEFNAALHDRPGYPQALLNQAIVAQQYFANPELALERYRAFLETSKDARQQSEVRLVVARLEEAARSNPVEMASLTPASRFNIPPVRTNLALTNPPPPSDVAVTPTIKTSAPALKVERTNQPVIVAAPKTNAVAATNVVTREEEAPPVPVEVVEVIEEPEFKVPKDQATATNSVQVAAAAPQPNEPLLLPRRTREPERSLLDRANPMRWFRSDEKPQPQPSVRAPGSETPGPPPVKRVPPQFARYQHRPAGEVQKGDRAQAEKHFVEGARAHLEQRLAVAIEAYRQAIAADPSYFDAQYNLGLAAMQTEDLPLALAANERAVQLKPRSADARYHFAMALREANYPVDAADQLRQLLADSPDDARAHLALANLYAQVLDEAALARRHYNRLLELAPNHPQAPAIRQWLSAQN